MANEKLAAGEHQTPINSQFAFVASSDWLKSFTDAPLTFYGAPLSR
jgi:hypothetical protein